MVYSRTDEIKLRNQSLEEFIMQLAERSEYDIVLAGEYDHYKISGIFYLTDIEETLRRVFKNTSTFIEYNNEEKVIRINLPKSGTVKVYSGDKTASSDPGKIDIETGMTQGELLALRENERQILHQRMSDPEEVDLLSGILYVDLLEMRENEKDEYIARTQSFNEIDPTTGLSFGELLSRRESEKQEIMARKKNHEEIDPVTGMSYQELLDIRVRDHKMLLTN